MHSVPFGPVVDGVIVPPLDDEAAMMARLKHYDIMMGVTQTEALLMFPATIGTWRKKSLKFNFAFPKIEA